MKPMVFAVLWLAIAICGLGVFTQVGHSAQTDTGTVEMGSGAQALDREALSEAGQRLRERRQEREGEKPWIRVPEITKERLRQMLGDPDLVVVDVTCVESRAKLTHRIPGSGWEDFEKFAEWAPGYPKDKVLVFYCA